MKKYSLLLSFIVFVIFLVVAAPVSVYADVSEKCKVYDSIDAFSEEEIKNLDEQIRDKAEKLDFDIAVVFTDEGPYLPDYYDDDEVAVITKEYADDIYDSIFVNDGSKGGIVFVADYSHSFFSFSTGRKNMDEYQRYIDWFIDDIRPYLRSHDSYGAAVKFIENADLRSYKKTRAVKSFGIGGIISLAVSAVICLGISAFYKKHNDYSSRHYLINRESRFIVRNDQFIRQYVTKTRIESSSSDGRSSGGGSHSSHGGGGSRI